MVKFVTLAIEINWYWCIRFEDIPYAQIKKMSKTTGVFGKARQNINVMIMPHIIYKGQVKEESHRALYDIFEQFLLFVCRHSISFSSSHIL